MTHIHKRPKKRSISKSLLLVVLAGLSKVVCTLGPSRTSRDNAGQACKRITQSDLSAAKRIYQFSSSAICAACIGAVSVSASAHHSHANLDRSKSVLHRGTVQKYAWVMPHVYMKVKAPNPDGELVTYSIEMLHPPGMAERGWDRRTFKRGDLIIWSGSPDKNPDRYYSGLTWAEKADGSRYTLTLDIDPVLPEPSTDFSGLWSRHLDVPRRYLPPDEWPYTEKARVMIANFDDSQNPQIECQDPGPPKANLLPYPLAITRVDEDTMVIEYDARNLKRTIHFNPNTPKGEPSRLGHSVARFEGETLVIETTNFTADRWGTYTGVNSSAQKKLVERLTLTDGGLSIDMEHIVTDPVYFSAPITIMHKLRKLPDRPIMEPNCSPKGAKMYLEAEKRL